MFRAYNANSTHERRKIPKLIVMSIRGTRVHPRTPPTPPACNPKAGRDASPNSVEPDAPWRRIFFLSYRSLRTPSPKPIPPPQLPEGHASLFPLKTRHRPNPAPARRDTIVGRVDRGKEIILLCLCRRRRGTYTHDRRPFCSRAAVRIDPGRRTFRPYCPTKYT